MGHNFLSEMQIKRLVDDLAAYIQRQRRKYLDRAIPLSLEDQSGLKQFFPTPILNMVRFLKLENELIENPLFFSELNEHGFSYPDLNTMEAVTFRDVVVVIKNLTPEVKFHELVHVTQYQELGIGGFADKYLGGLLNSGGYRSIPLEEQAYQLSERYIKNTDQKFSVKAEVTDWMSKRAY